MTSLNPISWFTSTPTSSAQPKDDAEKEKTTPSGLNYGACRDIQDARADNPFQDMNDFLGGLSNKGKFEECKKTFPGQF